MPATVVTSSSATFNGSIATGGAPVAWEFAYSLASNPFGGSYSSGGTIGAGVTATTPVLAQVTGLLPSTQYTFQLVATNVAAGVTYYLNTPVYGGPLTFTTGGPGSASLGSSKLKVKGGHVAVVVKCGTAYDCLGGALAITAKGKNCGTATFNLNAGQSKTIHTSHVSKKCAALLVASPKLKIKGTLKASFTYQKKLNKSVTLVLVK